MVVRLVQGPNLVPLGFELLTNCSTAWVTNQKTTALSALKLCFGFTSMKYKPWLSFFFLLYMYIMYLKLNIRVKFM